MEKYKNVSNNDHFEVGETKKKYGYKLEDRVFDFSVNIIQFLLKLPQEKVYDVFRIQLSKSGTSIGANYEEALGAFSRKEFKCKLGICLKEARETYYWLRIIDSLNLGEKYKRIALLHESLDLIKIFITSIKTCKSQNSSENL